MMLNKVADELLSLPRPIKRLIAVAVDVAICTWCVWLAFALRLEDWSLHMKGARGIAAAAAAGTALPIFVLQGFYRAIFRFSGTAALEALAKACATSGTIYAIIFTAIGVPGIPRSVGITIPLMIFVSIGASRLLARYWLGGLYQDMLKRKSLPQVVIYGAGSAGRQLAAALANSRDMVVCAFVDDAKLLQGASLNGLPIHAPAQLTELVNELGITDVLLAMPGVGRARRAEIVRSIQALKIPLHVRTLPDLADLVQGRVQTADIHELDIEDLLGRAPVPPDTDLLQRNVSRRVVLVTGAGGSIGSELCRQIVRQLPTTLLLVEVSEYALYTIHSELQEKVNDLPIHIVPLLASVRDEVRMREIMRTWRPDTVYHAAAYKHVPLVEHNPVEGVRNNVLGTLITARVATECRVKDFVLISTDKAVRPTNVMGATKRLAEMVLQGLAQNASNGPRFSMVRFGNVLGSSGSVVPLFRKQIQEGGPITLTHENITRYFMTIPEAAELVIQAGAMAEGGDVFVLDMGAPVRIIDLARRMVELSGLTVRDASNPNGDIEIVITGLRPGEKLYEELLIGDNPSSTAHPRIMKAHDDAMPWERLAERLAALEVALALNNIELLRQILSELVSGYQAAPAIVDWIHLKQIEQLGSQDAIENSTLEAN